jgi:acyl carrier protein
MNGSFRLPYLWKTIVAAAVIAVGIIAVREVPKWIPASVPPQQPAPDNAAVPADLYADSLSRVREIIAVHTSTVPEVVAPTMPLGDLGFDPLTRIEVAEALETAYRIELAAEELATAETVDDLVRLVVKKREAGESSR